MRVLPYGKQALLLEVDSAQERYELVRRLESRLPAGISEMVPAAQTVLLVLTPGADAQAVGRAVSTLPDVPPGHEAHEHTVTVDVHYDGPDLQEVARVLDITPDEVVRRHTGQEWTCEFVGFLPGFGYLSGSDNNLHVPRLDSPRSRVPIGSVALAAGLSAVYPSPSPGGWQLIGTTSERMFDVNREPAGLLRAGTPVRFVEA